ncbi:hypothetical protein OC25_03730 [Pedobacter kyungheensis]|uniref:Uncharacterized protein n=2 Tax=Pedobacter TaxID=84567 RepID=A0A1G6K141_9SPHI|nr:MULTISPECIES: hypothetical protein [Pedobacter]KIA96201.1 hypothetical protein OC25_03730 [Pedobacter kyungheensis]SDC24618.1 hypothetical protein SAMN04488024_101619 [Pedobacter soli]
MKTKMLFLSLCLAALWSCKGSKDLQSFIPGTYIDYARGEYSESSDTLIIGEFNEIKDSYPIIRKTGFRRIGDGKPGRLEHAAEKWLGIWDGESGSIQVPKNSKIISFYPDSGVLLLGTREYRKIAGGN